MKKQFYILINIVFCLMLVIQSFLMVPYQAEAQSSKLPDYSSPIDLMAPLNSSPTIYDGVAGIEDGKNVLYTTSKGVPAMFSVIDLDNGEEIRTLPLEDAADSWQHKIAPDGTVYVTAGKFIWGYSPETKEINALAEIPEASLWSLAVDEDSNAYIGTYPNGKVFKYDKQTKKLHDYGKMIGDINQEYVRSMDYHDGYIYAGTAHKQLIKLNVETGDKVNLAEELSETGFVYDLNIVDDRYIFARYDTTGNMYVYDLEEEKWLDVVISNVTGLHVTDSLDNNVYFIADGTLKYIDLGTLEVSETKMKYGSGLRGADWVEIKNDDRLPGKSLVTIMFNGDVAIFNIKTEKVITYPSLVSPTANVIDRVFSYSEDKIYISGMTGAVGAVYNPETFDNETFSLGQADVIHEYGEKVYFGVYPSGNVHNLDPDSNPSGPITEVFTIGEEQDRVHFMENGDGKLFVGSIPTYGKLGGAITVYDGDTKKVFRNIVQDQSINGLAYYDGKLYGSTSIHGGLGIDPTADEAKLFMWDPETEKVIKEVSLDIDDVDKPDRIGELTVGMNDDFIWGAADGVVFALDPDSLEVEKSVRISPNQIGSEVQLEWSKEGLLYANLGGSLYVIDPETLEYKYVANAGTYTIGEDGDIYFSKSANRTILSKVEVTQVSEYTWESIPVVNSSFEDGLEGWTSMFSTGDNYTFEVTTEEAYTGTHSLRIYDQMRDQSVALHSSDIPVIPGNEYLGEVMMYIESGHPSLLIRMYDEDGIELEEKTVQVSSNYGEWQKIEQGIVAPENAAFARVIALSTSYALTDAYFDDFAFYEKVKVSEIRPHIVEIDGFENIEVNYGTKKENVDLPSIAQIQLSNEERIDIQVNWDNGDPEYDGNRPGTYTFTGELNISSELDILNPDHLTATINIIVNAEDSGKVVDPKPTAPEGGSDNDITTPKDKLDKVVDPDKQEKNGEKLPQTATNMFNVFGVGVLLLLVGVGLVILKKKTTKRV